MPKRPTWFEKTVCPFCGRTNDAIGSHDPESRPPVDGDFAMCLTCGEWAVVDSCVTGGQRKPTTAEYDEVAADKEMRAMRTAWVMTMQIGAELEGRR
jgi:hypothetical protein